MGSVKNLKSTLKKGSGGGNPLWIKNIPKDGITVRFLSEPENWYGYSEYWESTERTFVPMVEGEIIPDDTRPSFRYLAVALDTTNDRVVPIKLPKTAANSLIMKYDKYGTMMDRDYDLEKFGEGLGTTYDVTPCAPQERNLEKYDLIDLEEVLLAARASATGEEIPKADPDHQTAISDFLDEDEDGDEESPEPDDSEHDYGEFALGDLFPDGKFRNDYTLDELNSMAASDYEELAEWLECEQSPKSIFAALNEDDEDVVYSEEDLISMRLPELKKIASSLGIDTEGLRRDSLVSKIIDEAEV